MVVNIHPRRDALEFIGAQNKSSGFLYKRKLNTTSSCQKGAHKKGYMEYKEVFMAVKLPQIYTFLKYGDAIFRIGKATKRLYKQRSVAL